MAPRLGRSALRVGVLALMLLVAGCGFRPLYGDGDGDGIAASGELSATRIEPIPDRQGQRLRTQLEILLGTDQGVAPARYSLRVGLGTSIRDVAIRQDETATRRSVLARANYTLVRIEDGTVLTTGSARAANGYNVGASDFATRVAQDDAIERAVEQLGLAIQTQLAIFFRGTESS